MTSLLFTLALVCGIVFSIGITGVTNQGLYAQEISSSPELFNAFNVDDVSGSGDSWVAATFAEPVSSYYIVAKNSTNYFLLQVNASASLCQRNVVVGDLGGVTYNAFYAKGYVNFVGAYGLKRYSPSTGLVSNWGGASATVSPVYDVTIDFNIPATSNLYIATFHCIKEVSSAGALTDIVCDSDIEYYIPPADLQPVNYPVQPTAIAIDSGNDKYYYAMQNSSFTKGLFLWDSALEHNTTLVNNAGGEGLGPESITVGAAALGNKIYWGFQGSVYETDLSSNVRRAIYADSAGLDAMTFSIASPVVKSETTCCRPEGCEVAGNSASVSTIALVLIAAFAALLF